MRSTWPWERSGISGMSVNKGYHPKMAVRRTIWRQIRLESAKYGHYILRFDRTAVLQAAIVDIVRCGHTGPLAPPFLNVEYVTEPETFFVKKLSVPILSVFYYPSPMRQPRMIPKSGAAVMSVPNKLRSAAAKSGCSPDRIRRDIYKRTLYTKNCQEEKLQSS